MLVDITKRLIIKCDCIKIVRRNVSKEIFSIISKLQNLLEKLKPPSVHNYDIK